MPGLLDFLSTEEGRMGLGLLAAAGPRSDGMGAGGRIQLAMQGMDARKQEALKAKLLQSQIDESSSQAAERQSINAERQAKTVEAGRINGLIANFGRPSMGMGATNQAESALPPHLQVPGQPQIAQSNNNQVMDLLRQGVPYERVKQMVDGQNLGRQEVSRTMKGIGKDGREYETQFDKFGGQVGEGQAQYRAPITINQGDRTTLADPYNFRPVGEFKTNMTLAEQNTDARGRASQSLAAQRFAFDKAGGAGGGEGGASQASFIKQFGKPSAGYRWTADGSQEFIPGGPADSKAGAEGLKKSGEAKDVIDILKQAAPLVEKSTSSYIGAGVDQAARAFGFGTDGANAAAQLKALEGALVSKMPKMSGPQSDKDVLLYKQMAGQIGDSTLPASTRKAAMETIREINQRHASPEQSSGGASGDWGGKQTPTAKPPTAMKGMVRGGFKFRGGDPSDQANWERQ